MRPSAVKLEADKALPVERDDQVILEEKMSELKVSPFNLMILAVCLLILITEGYDIVAMAFAAPVLQAAWTLSSTQMGVLLAASIVGLGAGGFLLTPAGDYLGRKPAIILGLVIAAVGTAAGAIAYDVPTMLATRLIAGLGLGFAMPVTVALAMETMPKSMNRLVVVIVMTGLPLGAMLGGLSSSSLMEAYGYQAIFSLGGAGALLVALLSLLLLPESPYFLARKPASWPRLTRTLRRLRLQLPSGAPRYATNEGERPKSTVKALFTPERRWITLLLWTTSFANLSMIYFFTNWLPTLFVAQNLPIEEAFKAVGIFNLAGALGGVVLAVSMKYLRPTAALAIAYFLSATGIVGLVLTPGSSPFFYLVLTVSGGAIVGSSFCLLAMINQFYPSSIRSTGSGYANGFGRTGAVFAPLAGGLALDLLHSPVHAFLVATVPAVIAFSAILVLRRLAPETGMAD